MADNEIQENGSQRVATRIEIFVSQMKEQDQSRLYIKSRKHQLAQKTSCCMFFAIILTVLVTFLPLILYLEYYAEQTKEINQMLIKQREISLKETSIIKSEMFKSLI